jgi:hypothetical protein
MVNTSLKKNFCTMSIILRTHCQPSPFGGGGGKRGCVLGPRSCDVLQHLGLPLFHFYPEQGCLRLKGAVSRDLPMVKSVR